MGFFGGIGHRFVTPSDDDQAKAFNTWVPEDSDIYDNTMRAVNFMPSIAMEVDIVDKFAIGVESK